VVLRFVMLFVGGLVGEGELTVNAGVEAVAHGKRIMNNKIFESATEKTLYDYVNISPKNDEYTCNCKSNVSS